MSIHEIRGGGVRALVAARGGKIVSLSGSDGREWLVQASERRPFDPDNTDFVAGEMAGWDECAPSIEPCTVDGREIPDHGDLWATAWVVEDGDAEALRLSAVGTSLDYSFTRHITSTQHGLRFDYEAAALRETVPFLWAAHPQFASSTGSSVRLPEGVDEVVDVLDARQSHLAWSHDLARLDTVPPGGCRKLYVAPETRVATAALRHADGAQLTMHWTGCRYLGLWFDNRAYSREQVVALEPSLGFRDSLAWALDHGDAPVLEPGIPLRWSLELQISPAI